MGFMRIILTKTNEVKIQRRADQKYDDTTLPAGVAKADIKEQIVVNPATAPGGADEPSAWPPTTLSRQTVGRILRQEMRDAAVTLAGLDDDATVPPAVKGYLKAIRNMLERAGLLRTE